MNRTNREAVVKGMRDGIPIALGYFAVAFSLGIAARRAGLDPLQGFISSILNHASAGEYAEFTVIESNSPYWEMALIILITNARYVLMSCALSQRISEKTGMLHRAFIGFGITDEIFGAEIAQPGYVNPYYAYGLMILSIPCWASGTAIGIIAGNILPQVMVNALSVALYGMFLAIIIPPARQNKVVAGVVLTSFLASYIASAAPVISGLSESMRCIILTVVISAIAAVLFPHSEEE